MFYCEPCRKKNKWPESFSGSYGNCEICGKTANCYSVPSYALPVPPLPLPPKRKPKAPNVITQEEDK